MSVQKAFRNRVVPMDHLRKSLRQFTERSRRGDNRRMSGRVFRFVGGAPLYIDNWAPFGGAQPTVLDGCPASPHAAVIGSAVKTFGRRIHQKLADRGHALNLNEALKDQFTGLIACRPPKLLGEGAMASPPTPNSSPTSSMATAKRD